MHLSKIQRMRTLLNELRVSLRIAGFANSAEVDGNPIEMRHGSK
jgi:hypothetical protein